MKITTKSGDEGWTSIRCNRPVRKDDERLEAMGAIDELNSFIGLAKCVMRSKSTRETLEICQKGLGLVCAEISTLPEDVDRLKEQIESKDVERIEMRMKKFEEGGKGDEGCFVLPGACRASAQLDICRAVCRRSERLVAGLYFNGGFVNQRIIEYLNRMSDLFFLMARSMEKKRHSGEQKKSDQSQS